MRHRAPRLLPMLSRLRRVQPPRRRAASGAAGLSARPALRLAGALASMLVLVGVGLAAANTLDDDPAPAAGEGAAQGSRLQAVPGTSRSAVRPPLPGGPGTPTADSPTLVPEPTDATDEGEGTPPAHSEVQTGGAGEPRDPRVQPSLNAPLEALTPTVDAAPLLQPSPSTPEPQVSEAPTPTATSPDGSSDRSPTATDEPSDEPSETPSDEPSETPSDDTPPQTTLDSGPSTEDGSDDSGEDEPEDVGPGDVEPPGLGDVAPPDNGEGPEEGESSDSDSAEFVFHASEEASFTCSLDGEPFRPCTSPEEYDDVDAGPHEFAVRAEDAAGNVDPSPAQWHWESDGGDES